MSDLPRRNYQPTFTTVPLWGLWGRAEVADGEQFLGGGGFG